MNLLLSTVPAERKKEKKRRKKKEGREVGRETLVPHHSLDTIRNKYVKLNNTEMHQNSPGTYCITTSMIAECLQGT